MSEVIEEVVEEVIDVEDESVNLQGYSAYEIAVMNGFEGTEQEWLDSLKGKDGTSGITPTIGSNGNWFIGDTDTGLPSRGETGSTGENGKDGYVQYTAGDNITIENNVISAEVPEIDLSDYATKEETGNLNNLDTTDKSSLVNAINEVASTSGEDNKLFEIALKKSSLETPRIDTEDYPLFLPLMKYLHDEGRGNDRLVKMPLVNIYTARDLLNWTDGKNNQIFTIRENDYWFASSYRIALDNIGKVDTQGNVTIISISVEAVKENNQITRISNVSIANTTVKLATKGYVDNSLANSGFLESTDLKTINGNSLVGSGDITIGDSEKIIIKNIQEAHDKTIEFLNRYLETNDIDCVRVQHNVQYSTITRKITDIKVDDVGAFYIIRARYNYVVEPSYSANIKYGVAYIKWYDIPAPTFYVVKEEWDNKHITEMYSAPITEPNYVWSNGIYPSSLTEKYVMLEGNINNLPLGTKNTTAYTPTPNSYNPATTKYVDEAIASAITTTLGGSY